MILHENLFLNIKVIFYATKLRFPKYPPKFYIFYMYVSYIYLLKRKKQFRMINIPDDALLYLFDRHAIESNLDSNNCVIVSSRFSKEIDLDKYAKISNDSAKKIVKIFAFDIPYDVIYISDTLRHNFNRIHLKEPVYLLPIPSTSIAIAEEVQVSLISSGHEISNHLCDVLLRNYFRGIKLVRKGDTFAVNVKKYAPEFIFNNFKTNLIENVYYKCVKIKYGENHDCADCSYFCVKGETELKQCAHAQDYIPAKMKYFIVNKFKENHLEGSLISKCPYGLEDRLDRLRKAVKPFLKHRNIKLKPVFLIQGHRGNAKNILVRALADELGLNIYRISNYEVSANAYSQTEIKIKNAFFKAKLCAPSIFLIDNFENFGRNHEGRHTDRIIDYFKSELTKNLTNNQPPVIVVCVSNSAEVPAELSRVFLEIFEFAVPNQGERKRILEWMVELKNLSCDFDVKEIAEKCHGFLYGDLEALVYYAQRNGWENKVDGCERSKLSVDDFNAALEKMQANYTESMGAPKVPKVQWSDVGGLNDVKAEIIRTINLPLKHPELLQNSGLRRSGILLYGPPGTGKTLLAKAVATECGLCFLSVKGPELLNMYVGQSEQNVREVFERAREASPCIIFFDELDSLAPNRGVSGDSGGVMDRVVSQLLSEMDGLNREATVFVIGATNRPDLIDPALLRPGRFDKLLYVGPAETHEAKVSVLKALTRNFRLADNTDLEGIVRSCPKNISGADFYGICSNAWMSAVRCLIKRIEGGEVNKDDVSHQDVIVGKEDFIEALKKVKPSISPGDLRYFERLKLELSSNK